MVEKLAERKRREIEAVKGNSNADAIKVSDTELFAQAGTSIKVVKGSKENT